MGMAMEMSENNQLEEPEQPHTTGECGQGWGCSAFSHPASPPLQGDEPLALWECLRGQEQWEGKGLLQHNSWGALKGFPAITSKTPFPMGCLVQNELQV